MHCSKGMNVPRTPDAFDMQDAEDNPDEEQVTCLHCGATGLYWQDTWDAKGNRKPRLFDDGKPHVCKPNAADFEDMS